MFIHRYILDQSAISNFESSGQEQLCRTVIALAMHVSVRHPCCLYCSTKALLVTTRLILLFRRKFGTLVDISENILDFIDYGRTTRKFIFSCRYCSATQESLARAPQLLSISLIEHDVEFFTPQDHVIISTASNSKL